MCINLHITLRSYYGLRSRVTSGIRHIQIYPYYTNFLQYFVTKNLYIQTRFFFFEKMQIYTFCKQNYAKVIQIYTGF